MSCGQLAPSGSERDEEAVRSGMTRDAEGLMQDDFPLTLHHIRRAAATCNPADARSSTLTEPGAVERATLRRGLRRASTASRARS